MLKYLRIYTTTFIAHINLCNFLVCAHQPLLLEREMCSRISMKRWNSLYLSSLKWEALLFWFTATKTSCLYFAFFFATAPMFSSSEKDGGYFDDVMMTMSFSIEITMKKHTSLSWNSCIQSYVILCFYVS